MIKKSKRMEVDDSLNITSMMDIFTIILVFLLKSYSTDAIAVQPSDELQLPMSSAQTSTELAVNVVVSSCPESVARTGGCVALVVDGETVITAMEEREDANGDSTLLFPEDELRGELIAGLVDALEIKADMAKRMGERLGNDEAGFNGRILLQADRLLSFEVIRQVMYTAGQAQYGEFRFVVRKPS